ncbi:3-isopropylmalate dehydratase large subunit [Labrenzia sp. OB1]|uniref:3-isopropylmalate dehydratase large subunit n=1 Tax=Labrenzia sp. OB1 TaxID=1561204 RepID=UPI0007B2ADF8|nr:3-isopropylmalate dehydratase large subunit [Labrenzia sp. OB1]KZM52140.1 isopropylmalate isomerase [Labrenzia sp. OB1]
MSARATLFDKVWDRHVVVAGTNGLALIWVDRHFVHEGSHHAFAKLAARGLKVAEPELTFGVVDHYAPTQGPLSTASEDIQRMVRTVKENTRAHGVECFDLDDPRQGIVHVIGPEQGLTLPGLTINCGDSHTSTHGAFGAIAFGIGATDVAHVLATQTIWQSKPKRMRITIDGKLGPGVGAKDMALSWIAELGADAAQGHAVEYAGSAVRDLTMEGRMTLCNLSIEGGARCGMVAPDETTFAYLRDRPRAPKGEALSHAIEEWLRLASDDDAVFDRDVVLDGAEIAPTVTWGTSPEEALPVTASVPDPERLPEHKRFRAREALDYMGLVPGRPISGTPVDQVFIGSCTNGRIEDLRSAAAVLSGRKAKVPGIVSPGSRSVKLQAEQEGLDRIFTAAGLQWVTSGCSMCVGMNGDTVGAGQRCASTTNRNFKGRQGPGARTHLMSPVMVAAAAVTGEITDVRPFLEGRS